MFVSGLIFFGYCYLWVLVIFISSVLKDLSSPSLSVYHSLCLVSVPVSTLCLSRVPHFMSSHHCLYVAYVSPVSMLSLQSDKYFSHGNHQMQTSRWDYHKRVIHHSRECVYTALQSSGGVRYTTAFKTLLCAW